MRGIMKIICGAGLLLILAVAPDAQTKTATRQTTTAPKRLEIPQSAVRAQAGSYHYTDPKGKKWVYFNGPLRVSRADDVPPPKKDNDSYANVQVNDQGATVHL